MLGPVVYKVMQLSIGSGTSNIKYLKSTGEAWPHKQRVAGSCASSSNELHMVAVAGLFASEAAQIHRNKEVEEHSGGK